MKNNLLILLLIITVCTIFTAQALNNENFEIFNKAHTPIVFSLYQDAFERAYVVYPNKNKPLEIDIQKTPLFVSIYPDTIDTESLSRYNPRVFRIEAPGKTKYLTWDPTKKISLYPQTGPLKGLAGKYQPNLPIIGPGKTKSGYPLNNNVTANQIK